MEKIRRSDSGDTHSGFVQKGTQTVAISGTKRRKTRGNASSCTLPVGKGSAKSRKPSRSKKSAKIGSADICSDYEFSDGEKHHRQLNHINEGKNVLDIARDIPSLSIFVDLVERAGIDFIFACDGPFTVLPPSNRAFRSLDPAIFADLLIRDKKGRLDNILLSHVIPKLIFLQDFEEMSSRDEIAKETVH